MPIDADGAMCLLQGALIRVGVSFSRGVMSAACSAIRSERSPLHAYPGALAYSFGMLGCDLHCAYCQNWVTSQALRDPHAIAPPRDATPAALVADARRQGARLLVSTYNEPLITSEWAVEIFREARTAGLVTGFVSNGNGTTRVLEYIRPHIALQVDLRASTTTYGAWRTMRPFRDTRWLHAAAWGRSSRCWCQGSTTASRARGLTAFVASAVTDIHWHATAFHQDSR